jgi:branched-chain amino acid:cation transporter, LIVCS family
MKSKSAILSTGLAMFSMFFGSGNLVFPILVGQFSQGHTFLSSLGMLCTGVLVPFLGIFAMVLFQGDTKDFFARLGKFAPFWFSLFCLAIMGPFGVLARCLTVSHGAFCLLIPNTPLWLFSLFSCVALFLLTFRKNKIVPLLGSILTPLLLLSLGAIAFFGLTSGSWPAAAVSSGSGWEGFRLGFFKGYQMMDLLAAFFFSTFIITHLKQRSQESSSPPLTIFFKSALLGAGLLSTVYMVFILLGAKFAPLLQGVPAPELLSCLAFSILGSFAAPVASAAIMLACFTTAIVLTSLFSDFLKKEVSKDRIPSWLAIVTTLAIGFFISTLGFSGIMSFIGPILEAIYPALIVLTVLNISYKVWGWKAIRMPTAATFVIKFLSSFV